MDSKLEIFYDGSCSFCSRKAARLIERDINGRLILTNLAANPYVCELYDISVQDALAEIHGVRENYETNVFTVFRGYELLVEIQRTLGNKKTAWVLSLPVIRQVGTVLFNLASKYRRFL